VGSYDLWGVAVTRILMMMAVVVLVPLAVLAIMILVVMGFRDYTDDSWKRGPRK
jgi:hypothetical protein